METKKIQLLLNKHGKNVSSIARDLKVSHAVVSRTLSNDSNSSRRVRLYVAKVVGYMPSQLWDLSASNCLLEDFFYCASDTDTSFNLPLLTS